jgi:alkylation response protein AidB-like acyl-CoA dehydrogenase
MEFELQDDHVEVRDLVAKIFSDLATLDRVSEVEKNESGFDRKLYGVLADSGMLGIAVPEAAGGAGLGMLGLVAVLEQQGRRLAAVPLWSVVAGAALPIAEFASDEQAGRWLPDLLEGRSVVTGAFDAPPGQRAVLRGRREGDDLVVSGEILHVPAGGVADAVVVPVTLEDGSVRVAVVPTSAAGLTMTPVSVTSHENAAAATFADVVVDQSDLLPADGEQVVDWTRTRLRVALSALQVGICEEALRITADYTSQRVQFGRPISTNQAVSNRAADGHLDTEAIRLTAYKAAWLLDSGAEAEASSASLVAKWWAATGGLRVVLSGQHLHGGIGADVDYPIHRYFLWGRQVAFTLGSAGAVAAELGDALETAPAIGASS